MTVFSLEKQNNPPLPMTRFYVWLCFTFRALLFLSVVMVQLSLFFSPPQAPVKPDTHNLKKQTQTTSHEMWDTVHFWFIACLTFTIRSQDMQSCTTEEKGEPADLSCFSKARRLIIICGFMWKTGEVLKVTCLSLLAGIIRRKLSCGCPLVAQSRCPNQFPEHFLLSAQHQRFEPLVLQKTKNLNTWFLKGTLFKQLNLKNYNTWFKNKYVIKCLKESI